MPVDMSTVPYTPAQMCRVRSYNKAAVQPGTLLARQGAWQHKSVVRSVTFVGTVENEFHVPGSGSSQFYDEWTVGVEYVGQFFADGRAIPCTSPDYRRHREFTVRTQQGGTLGYGLGGYHGGLIPVVPADVPPDKVLYVDKPPRAKPYKPAPYMDVSPTAAKAAAPRPAAPRPAEAILADFLVD